MGHAAQNGHHTQLEWGSVHNVYHTLIEMGTQDIMYITKNRMWHNT